MPEYQFIGSAVSEISIEAESLTEARRIWREQIERRPRFRRGRVEIQLLADSPAIVDETGTLHRQSKPKGVCASRSSGTEKHS